MKDERKKTLTLQDLQDAVDVINEFAAMYSKAQYSVKKLAKEQGRYGGMMGRGSDPITTMLFGSMEGMIERKMEEIAEKKARQLGITAGIESGAETEELAEAKSGLDGSEEEEEEEET